VFSYKRKSGKRGVSDRSARASHEAINEIGDRSSDALEMRSIDGVD